MDKSAVFIYGICLLAQLLFSIRILTQWVQSERAGKVLSPASFWTASVIASALLMLYGVLRHDVSIVGGQFVSYFIYLRNMKLKHMWREVAAPVRWAAMLFPIAALLWLLSPQAFSFSYMLEHSNISGTLVAWGGAGQFVFSLRFLYQWYYAEQKQESVLPLGFWVISLIGGLMILSYAVLRLDPILFLGQVFGIIAYSRNLVLASREEASEAQTAAANT